MRLLEGVVQNERQDAEREPLNPDRESRHQRADATSLVMETGGFLSHCATVAREYAIPAVVNIPGILGQLADGDQVIIDGDDGRVRSFR